MNAVEVVEAPSPELAQFFERRIEEFILERWEEKERRPLAVTVRNDEGEIVGGVSARTFGLWLLIDNLWVHESLRGQDMGSRILTTVEQAAIQRGCRYSLLDTLGFQARPFYERFGYRVQWEQPQYPRTGSKFFMTKELVPVAAK